MSVRKCMGQWIMLARPRSIWLLPTLIACLLSLNLCVHASVLAVVALASIAARIRDKRKVTMTCAPHVASLSTALSGATTRGLTACHTAAQTTSAFIIGTSAFLSYCCKRVASQTNTLCRLLSAFWMVLTRPSTKTLSDKYSDL